MSLLSPFSLANRVRVRGVKFPADSSHSVWNQNNWGGSALLQPSGFAAGRHFIVKAHQTFLLTLRMPSNVDSENSPWAFPRITSLVRLLSSILDGTCLMSTVNSLISLFQRRVSVRHRVVQ